MKLKAKWSRLSKPKSKFRKIKIPKWVKLRSTKQGSFLKTDKDYRDMIEKYIGRLLNDDERVHHIDCDHFNNDLSNLCVLSRTHHREVHGLLNAGILTKDSLKSNLDELKADVAKKHVEPRKKYCTMVPKSILRNFKSACILDNKPERQVLITFMKNYGISRNFK
jgi:hypothetical protein